MEVGLGFVPEAEAQGEIRPHAPVVAGEQAGIELAAGDGGNARIDAELRRSPAQLPDLCGGPARLQKVQGSPVALDGADVGREDRARSAGDGLEVPDSSRSPFRPSTRVSLEQ